MSFISTIGSAAVRSFGFTKSAIASAVDAFFNRTTLLLSGDGTNGAQNNTFLDSSSNNFTVTRNGNTTQGTFSPFAAPAGYWSIFFNNSNSDAIPLGTTVFDSLPAAFTFEAWVFPTRYGSSTTEYYNTCIFGKGATYMNFGLTSTGKLQLYHYDGSQRSNASTGTVPLNTWTHVAAVISGGVITFYINGAASGTATWYGIASAGNGSSDTFGYTADGNASTNRYFGGYISNARFIKSAVYSSAFTPSVTPLANAVSGTNATFLIAQANRFIDASVSPITLTGFGGTPSVQPFSPFAPAAAYSAATNGGSGYFDGTGDYIVTSGAALDTGAGTADVTFECWVYNNGYSGSQYGRGIFTFYPSASYNTSRLMVRLDISTNKINCYWIVGGTAQFGASGTTSTASATPGAWTHVALVRSSQTFKLYINGVLDTTLPATTASLSTFDKFDIGRTQDGTGPDFNGNISGFRYLKGTAQYTVAFTPPTSPPTAITNTQLLLNFTNGGIIDATGKNVLETVGNVQISTTQSKWGGGSLYFDGTGDYLQFIASNLNTNLGTGDFTIEMWLYPNAWVADTTILYKVGGFQLQRYGSNSALGVVFPSGWAITNATLPSTSTWTHVAVTRQSGSVKIWINGTQSGSTATNNDAAAFEQIGGQGAAYNYNGYIDDLRITKGYARYTANFTPPTQAFALQ